MSRLAPRLAALAFLALAPLAAAQEPATTAKKLADIYDPTADTQAQLDSARKIADRDHSRVLVMFGGNWCGWCHKLHGLFGSDRAIAKVLHDEYTLVMVDTEAPGAVALLDRCKAALPPDELARGVGYPFLAVIEPDGSIAKAQRTDPLEEGDHHDPALVLAFLTDHKAPAVDARDVLKTALARAQDEDRRVFLHFGAPWCGWCHRLDDFLAREEIASIMARDFIDLKIDVDRMTNGQEVLDQFCAKPGGIPWIVILEPDGTPIVNSDSAKGNIGYPVEAFEIDHFLAMLRKSARKIEPAQIQTIEAELKAAAERIRPPAPAR